jgi:putative nucleotidyltransferase with HDIG domain
MTINFSQQRKLITQVESTLSTLVQSEEAAHSKTSKPANSLWSHVMRVALLAERLGRAEGVDPLACRLAGIFHDAGKFKGGSYHEGDRAEEEWSVKVLRQITKDLDFDPELIDQVEDSILQLYRDDPSPSLLTKVLFDADNLDKLGPLGIANFFIKTGLRGQGINESFLYRVTVELTYARHAPKCLATKAGRDLARKRAPATIRFFKEFLESLREEGLYDFRIEEVMYDNLLMDVVAPVSCQCGDKLYRRIWQVPGLKCSEIHLQHACDTCAAHHEVKFCRPRLL